MVTLEQIRAVALNLPAVTEDLHFRLPTFKIGDKGFITVQNNAAIMALPEELSKALSNDEPDKFELVRRNKKHFVGLKARLQNTSIIELKPLILQAYEYRKLKKK
ncbi:MAG: MmcQ/YjbR family DNA-binding protein [Chitinophagaceae bacterium]|nr:MmcQ/YjbR family DNA-binding protein [Chitinophagaceae bacterium]